jgi:hypothetical protein
MLLLLKARQGFNPLRALRSKNANFYTFIIIFAPQIGLFFVFNAASFYVQETIEHKIDNLQFKKWEIL